MDLEDRDQLNRLLQLAQNKSQRSREIFVENVSDFFMSDAGRLNDHQRALMTQIMFQLVDSIEESVRAELAERFSQMENVPRDLVTRFANEEIGIARPILERSSVLRDPDLIEIIKQRGDEHRLSIALRHQLSEVVSDALVEHGGEDVIEALINNSDAGISERAMEYLVAESRRVDRFQEPLLSRNDLSTALAHRMYWWVSAALRRHILLDFELDEVELDSAIEDATKRAIVDSRQSDGTMLRAQKLVVTLRENGELTLRFLMQTLRQQRLPVFVAAIGELAHIGTQMAWQIFSDEGSESLAIVCKAIGVERSDFTTMYLLITQARSRQSVASTSVFKDILDFYDSLELKNAQAALQHWQRDAEYQKALDDLNGNN